jgi:hypothetical protein
MPLFEITKGHAVIRKETLQYFPSLHPKVLLKEMPTTFLSVASKPCRDQSKSMVQYLPFPFYWLQVILLY